MAGGFSRVGGLPRTTLVRLLPTGALDDSFGQNPQFDGAVSDVAVQSDGRIFMGGLFEMVDGMPTTNFARLNPNGTLDAGFKLARGASGPVSRIRLQPDGKIDAGGVFDMRGGRASKKLGRLDADGTIDASFRPPNPNGDVNDMVCLPDAACS